MCSRYRHRHVSSSRTRRSGFKQKKRMYSWPAPLLLADSMYWRLSGRYEENLHQKQIQRLISRSRYTNRYDLFRDRGCPLNVNWANSVARRPVKMDPKMLKVTKMLEGLNPDVLDILWSSPKILRAALDRHRSGTLSPREWLGYTIKPKQRTLQ